MSVVLGRQRPAAGWERMLVRPWLLISAAWTVPAALAAIEQYMQGRLGNRPASGWRDLLWSAGDWLLYAALTPAVLQLGSRVPLRRPHLARRAAIHLAASLALCVVWAALGTALLFVVRPGNGAAPTAQFLVSWIFTTLPFGVAVYFALLGVERALLYFSEAREREAQAARLAAQLAEARLGALRMQLNPHFLFNSLNAINVLLRDRDTTAATRMVELLSGVLREVLRPNAPHEAALAAELAFLDGYLAIEKVRFSDRLRPRFEVDPAVLDAAVPSFILQPLVENALQHGIARRAAAGELVISARREGSELVLAVRDDGPGPSAGAARTGGVGVANTRERLAALYGNRARFELADAPGGGAISIVRLPYRPAADGEPGGG